MTFAREPDAEPIAGYRLIEPLGSGGFGEVWKCLAPGGIYKAIKFVYGNLNSLDAEGVRAEQELEALEQVKQVRHPFVLQMDRIEIVEGELVIVMELADKSLYDEYAECQAAGQIGIPRDVLLRYIRDAAEALDHMIEKHNLLHLDIKPRNLFLVSDRVKVADFGLVKHLERQSASGILGAVTPLYAPPETINNKITQYSDQYSLAIVYQELLTGQRPFTGKNARQLAMQHLNEEPEVRALPEAERPVVARALAKVPEKRWPNCLAFVRALYNASHHGRIVVRDQPPQSKEKLNEPVRKGMTDTMEELFLQDQNEVDLGEMPAHIEGGSVSQLGMTVAQPETGALRPTVVLGIGQFGRRALIDLRCRFLDRFGDLNKLPLMRFLYIDCDGEAVKAAQRGAPEVALSNGVVYHLPLQPPANYRRRMLDHLNEWLPREKLHSIPRSLVTAGCRALGRLAFADNHHRLLTRLRRDIQEATHPDSLYQAVNFTGLALRDTQPRIYVLAAAGGGSSGFLADLGYGLRRVLKQLKFPEAEVIAFLLCGAPGDPATPKLELANVYACLTELNHYSESASRFVAQYGPDAQPFTDEDPPYASSYLLQMQHRTPEDLRDTVAHLGSYIFHDVTTPFGLRLDKARHAKIADGATAFRSLGTFAVWFPRGLLLRLAARQMCARLIDEWQAVGNPTALDEVEAACEAAVADPELQFEAICARIEEAARAPVEGGQQEDLTGFLSRLEEQSGHSVAQEDPGAWAQQSVARLQEWIGAGTGGSDSSWRKSRLARALTATVQQLAKEWDEKLSRVAFSLMERNGRRLAAAETALQRFSAYCVEATAAPRATLQQHARKAEQLSEQLGSALESCMAGGGFSLFGSRSKKLLKGFMEQLVPYARQRLTEEITGAAIHFLSALHARIEERLRELAFCRGRLRNLQQSLEAAPDDADAVASGQFATDANISTTPAPSAESYYEMIRESSTVRVVLPDGEKDLERAADAFLSQLKRPQWEELDQLMQDRVLAPLGGLHYLCIGSGDLLRNLAGPLLDQAASCLGELLPVTDVAEVELSAARGEKSIQSRAQSHYQRAAPLVADRNNAGQQGFLLLPASDAGKQLGDEVRQALPGLHLVRVPGQADLMFCREQANLSPDEIREFLKSARAAYEQLSPVPSSSPHSRFDILDWIPLDPY